MADNPERTTRALLLYVKALVEEATGMQNCKIGVPASLANVLDGFVTAGPQLYSGHTTETFNRQPRLTIVLGYMVRGAEATAELALADAIDAITKKLVEDRKWGGLVQSVQWDTAIGDSPEYRSYAGREYRMYPIVVQVKWTEHYGG